MELDNKQKVLLAMYVEYQKDLPEMDKNIKAGVIGLPQDVFYVALDKLVNEELITDVVFSRGGNGSVPLMAFLNKAKLTRVGLDYVENKLQIEKILDGKGKVQKVAEKAGLWGLDQIKDMTAKVLAEMVSKAVGI